MCGHPRIREQSGENMIAKHMTCSHGMTIPEKPPLDFSGRHIPLARMEHLHGVQDYCSVCRVCHATCILQFGRDCACAGKIRLYLTYAFFRGWHVPMPLGANGCRNSLDGDTRMCYSISSTDLPCSTTDSSICPTPASSLLTIYTEQLFLDGVRNFNLYALMFPTFPRTVLLVNSSTNYSDLVHVTP